MSLNTVSRPDANVYGLSLPMRPFQSSLYTVIGPFYPRRPPFGGFWGSLSRLWLEFISRSVHAGLQVGLGIVVMICATLVDTQKETPTQARFNNLSSEISLRFQTRANQRRLGSKFDVLSVYWPNSRVVKLHDNNNTYSFLVYFSTIFVGFHL